MKATPPALFDKLTFKYDKNKKKNWHEMILRDIEFLLNDASRSADLKLSEYAHCMTSVINYGLPSLSKRIPVSVEPLLLAKHIQKIISTFEPRLIPDSIRVVPLSSSEQRAVLAILFDIYGIGLFTSGPEPVNLRIALDYSCGAIRVL